MARKAIRITDVLGSGRKAVWIDELRATAIETKDRFTGKRQAPAFDVRAPNIHGSDQFDRCTLAEVVRLDGGRWMIRWAMPEAHSSKWAESRFAHGASAKAWAVKVVREACELTWEEQQAKDEQWAGYWAARGF